MKSGLPFAFVFCTISQLSGQEVPKGGVSPIAELIKAGDPVASPVIPDTTGAPKPAVFPETHAIRSGDNPWTIAKQYGISMEELVSLNKIKNTKNLQIGQVLMLPKPQAPAAHQPIESPVAEPVSDPEGHEVYVVQKGDNPWTIARKLSIDYEALIDLNQDADPKDLKIGQKLKLPKKGKVDPVVDQNRKDEEPAFDADGHDVYVLKRGDNPWTVAKKLKVDYQALINLNQIEDPRDLKIGQKLKIPKEGEIITSFPGALEGEAPKTPFDAGGHEVYVIKPGDNPWMVAKNLNIDYEELIELNGISNPRDLKIGQKLKLPKKE